VKQDEDFLIWREVGPLNEDDLFKDPHRGHVELQQLADRLGDALTISAPEDPKRFHHAPADGLDHVSCVHVVRGVGRRDVNRSPLTPKLVDRSQDLRDMSGVVTRRQCV
jgi:hypothetical protein